MIYTQHPLSAAFPAMQADEFQALKDSIESIGVQNPITLLDGMVIDGWHRYSAAAELGMHCPTVKLDDTDPRDFVMAQNKARRHITAAQLAMATTAVYQWHPAHRKEAHTECALKTNAQLAEISGVHKNTITQAKSVQSHAAPEVIEAVKRGEVGLPKAAAIAKLPMAEQAAALNKPTPKPVAEPIAEEPPEETELDAVKEALSILNEENDRLNDKLAIAQLDATEEERSAAHTTILALRAENKTLIATNRALILSRDSLMEENSQMKRQMAMQRKEIDKLKNTK